jgi:hypothetical protein
MDQETRNDSGRRVLWTVTASMLVSVLSGWPVRGDEPMAPPSCAARLAVAVTPDVPDPTDGAFLSSLLGDHPGYQLFLLKRDDDSHVRLQLQGPGPMERCQEVVDFMRKDGRVQSIDVS